MSRGQHTSSPGVRRWVLVGALVALVAGAVALHAATDGDDARAVTVVPVVAAAPVDADGVAFYCAAGSAHPEGVLGETVVAANVGATPAEVTITVQPGGGEAPVQRVVELAAWSQVRVPVAEIAPVADPGVTVEVRGGEVSVAHAIGPAPAAVAPCARMASTQWYLAGGTTVRGVEQWLTLYNPFPAEAIVDVTFFTEEGTKRPENLRGLTVSPHSRRVVAVHEEVRRLSTVAFELQARVGQVVVEQVLRGNGEDGFGGTALSLAAAELAEEWVVVDGARREGAPEALVVMNPADEESRIEVTTLLRDPELTLEPVTGIVPPRSAIVITLPDGIPDAMEYAHHVRVLEGAPVAVEQRIQTMTEPASLRTSPGIAAAARDWVVPMAREAEAAADLVVVNTGREATTIEIEVVGGGSTRTPEAGAGVEVPAGRSVVVAMDALGATAADAVVVRSAAPVWVAQRGESGTTLAAAVPRIR